MYRLYILIYSIHVTFSYPNIIIAGYVYYYYTGLLAGIGKGKLGRPDEDFRRLRSLAEAAKIRGCSASEGDPPTNR